MIVWSHGCTATVLLMTAAVNTVTTAYKLIMLSGGPWLINTCKGWIRCRKLKRFLRLTTKLRLKQLVRSPGTSSVRSPGTLGCWLGLHQRTPRVTPYSDPTRAVALGAHPFSTTSPFSTTKGLQEVLVTFCSVLVFCESINNSIIALELVQALASVYVMVTS